MAVADETRIKCSSCDESVRVEVKLDHQRHHKALKTLKFKQDETNSLSINGILKRRKQILKKIIQNSESSGDSLKLDRRINKIDEAFDVVRSNLERERSVFQTLNPLINRVRVKQGGLCFTEKEIYYDVKSSPVWGNLPRCVDSMGTSYAVNIQNRDAMEDRMTTYPQFVSLDRRKGTKPSSAFLGVYDGHRGQQAAELTQLFLHHFIKEEIEQEKTLPTVANKTLLEEKTRLIDDDKGGGMLTETGSDEESNPNIFENFKNELPCESVLRGCKRGYQRMDDYLSWGINETSKVRWSSCSVMTCIIDDEISNVGLEVPTDNKTGKKMETALQPSIGRLYVTNAGNVEAYICQNYKPFPLTQRHTTSNENECRRIEKMGGTIVRNGKNILVNGLSSTTRGLGNHGDVPLRRCVTNEPFTATARLTKKSQFVVIATESVWSVFSVEEVFEMVNSTEKYVQSIKKELSAISNVGEFDNARSQLKLSRTSSNIRTTLTDEGDQDENLNPKIEEVVIVLPAEDEEDDENTSNRYYDLIEEDIRKGSSRIDYSPTIESGIAYKTWLAAAMSNRIVQAAIQAGATDNVSVVVILFQGYFC